MTLRLYDTATRSVREFVPRVPGQVGVYLCGVTVQAGPHIGHLRSGVNYDVLRRWLVHSGYAVRFIRNITDIDDKVLEKSVEAGEPFWSIAYTNERRLIADYAALGVQAPTYEPRATGHIPEMHELIKLLIDKGHAYPVDDASGDVYFDVRSFGGYGALSGQRPDAIQPAEDGSPRAKRDPRDFALWKGAKAGEPPEANWPSPWGSGRPGWHIECSAMCWRYLGEEFDIHGGGLDLVFPHHENELAQSRAAGLGFARYWVHHALLNLGTSKMSKSVGNVIDLAAVVALGVRPVELRYYLAAPHYRSMIDYSDESLREAAAGYRRIEGFVRRANEWLSVRRANEWLSARRANEGLNARRANEGLRARRDGPAAAQVDLPADFIDAMDDDLNTSRALAVLHETVHHGNIALSCDDENMVAASLAEVRQMLGILGLDPFDPQWTEAGDAGLTHAVDALVSLALDQRAAARARKDWAGADAVREQLKQAGIAVEDTPSGPRWTLADTQSQEGDA